MSGGIFSLFDFRAVAGTLGILAAAGVLIAWQQRGDPAKCRNWLGYSAAALEILAASLALAWAVLQFNGLLTIVFAVGFVGLALSKASITGALVHSYRTGNRPALSVGSFTLSGIYLVVYAAGVFGGTHDTAEKTATAAASSAPIVAVDAELSAARQRLANLAGFADAGKAAQEETALQAAAAAQAARIAELQAAVDSARTAAAPYANPDCTPKKDRRGEPFTSKAAAACAAIQAAENALQRASGGELQGGGGYGSRHTEYNGLSQHIAQLEKRRAELLANGGAAQAQAAGADDRLVGWIAGIEDMQKAAGLKWLLLVLAFDVLSLGIRLFSELHNTEDDPAIPAIKRFSALLGAGFEPEAAAAILAGNTAPTASIPPAQTQPMPIMSKLQAAPMAFNQAAPIAAPNHQAAPNSRAYGNPQADTQAAPIAAPGASRTVFRDRERVPPELSGIAAPGRVGKVDCCRDCGGDFLVLTYNGTRCPQHAAAAESSYRKAKARKGKRTGKA